ADRLSHGSVATPNWTTANPRAVVVRTPTASVTPPTSSPSCTSVKPWVAPEVADGMVNSTAQAVGIVAGWAAATLAAAAGSTTAITPVRRVSVPSSSTSQPSASVCENDVRSAGIAAGSSEMVTSNDAVSPAPTVTCGSWVKVTPGTCCCGSKLTSKVRVESPRLVTSTVLVTDVGSDTLRRPKLRPAGVV